MSVMDKLIKYMKFDDNDDDEEYYDNDMDYVDDAEERKPGIFKEKDDTDKMEEKPKKTLPRVSPLRQTRKVVGSGMEVCVIKPTSVDDAKEITETLLANRTVVLNLEGLDVDIAQRIIDFTSGSCFAISGNLQKISHYIFIITPASVDISGDFQEILGTSFDVPINN